MVLPITEHVEEDIDGPVDPLANPTSPKILNMRAYLCNGKPLYYGNKDESSAYCLPEKQWVSKPTYMDYFDEREILPSDLGNVVIHGLMDDQDFSTLDQAGLIDPLLKQIYEKMRELTGKIQELQQAHALGKSEDEEGDDDDEEEESEELKEDLGTEESEESSPTPSEPEESVATEEAEVEEGTEPQEEGGEVNPAFGNLLSAIKDGVSSSVLDQILSGVKDLDIYEKKILKLVSEKFGRSESTSTGGNGIQ